MQLRTVSCDVAECGMVYTESSPGAGFPGWGLVAGLQNSETGESVAHLCPMHLQRVAQILRESDK